MRELPWFLAIIAIAVAAVAFAASGWAATFVVMFVGLGIVVSMRVGTSIARDVDRQWLPLMLPLAFMAKMLGTAVRYYVVAEYYGYGDAFGYHRDALELAPVWRSLQVPIVTQGSFGTQVTKQITGLVYSIVTPPMIGGFMVFSALAFIGMVCFYIAFRKTMPRWGVLPYFVLLFFLPTMAFWPSSVGKDALMILGLGLLSLGTVRLFSARFATGALLVAAGGLLSVLIRPHVLAITVGSIVLAVILTRAGRISVNRTTRVVVLVVSLIALAWVLPLAASRIGVDEGLESFLANQREQTAQGGSQVTGEPATSPLELPSATLRVLFRPLPNEASSPGMLLSSLEGLLLLGLSIWSLPTMWANRRVARRTPYMIYSLAFTGAFIIAFSSIFNLGILARQRAQVIPLLLVVLIGLGWRKWSPDDEVAVEEIREEINT